MSKLIRVLHTEWSDGWGGQEIRIIHEMKKMRSEGVEVYLACRDKSLIKRAALDNNIKVFTLPFQGNADLKTLLSLKKIIRTNLIDIVNTHSGKDTWVGGLAAISSGTKFIRTRHLSNKINPSRFNFINELADYIFTTGEVVKSNMIRFNRIKKDKILSVPTGIESRIFDPSKYNLNDCRANFNFKEDEIIIGILAVLRKFKRHDLFLDSAKALIEKYPKKKLIFVIAGDGPQKDNIKKIINTLNLQSNVKMLGHINNVPEFLRAIDILVLSSDSKEGVPQSVMQGLFMNKPVVATNCGSTKDLYFKKNFQLVNPGDSSALVEGISNYIDNNHEVFSREHMINHYSSSVMTRSIIHIYKKILS
jgi:glycosyltransferase involved in cell wall biosynthesis